MFLHILDSFVAIPAKPTLIIVTAISHWGLLTVFDEIFVFGQIRGAGAPPVW